MNSITTSPHYLPPISDVSSASIGINERTASSTDFKTKTQEKITTTKKYVNKASHQTKHNRRRPNRSFFKYTRSDEADKVMGEKLASKNPMQEKFRRHLLTKQDACGSFQTELSYTLKMNASPNILFKSHKIKIKEIVFFLHFSMKGNPNAFQNYLWIENQKDISKKLTKGASNF